MLVLLVHYTSFYIRKIPYINLVSKLVHRLSVLTSVCTSVYRSMFLVIVSSTKPLDIATLNIAMHRSHDEEGTLQCFV